MKKWWKPGILIVACLLVWGYVLSPLPPTPQEIEEVLEEALPVVGLEPEPVLPSVQYSFIKVTDGCGPHYDGSCLNVRSAPTSTAAAVTKLRTGVVLPVDPAPVIDDEGNTWYKVSFREWIRYPERVSKEWFVSAAYVSQFEDLGSVELTDVVATTSKRILVDRSEQKMYAYDGDELFMEASVSTGLALTPTPRGTFTIYRKTPSRYMQGPLPGISDDYYDLPGVPWNLYFTKEGGAIHGAYWHNSFGQPWSHGCVNLPLDQAEEIYNWAPLGTTVTVRD